MSGLRVAIRTVALCTQNVSAPPIGGRSQPTTSTLLNVPMLSLAAVLLATSFFSSRPVPTLSTQVRSRRPRLTPHPAMTSPIPSAVSTPASIWSRRRNWIGSVTRVTSWLTPMSGSAPSPTDNEVRIYRGTVDPSSGNATHVEVEGLDGTHPLLNHTDTDFAWG